MESPNDLKQTVDRLFAPLIGSPSNPEKGKSVGILVGVTLQGTRFYFHYGDVGLHQGSGSVPYPEMVLFIGSNSKVVTATLLALSAIKSGTSANLDTPVASLLPGNTQIDQTCGEILLWHLATHSAGFPDGPCGPRSGLGNYPFTSMRGFLNTYTQPYAPGQTWFYSNQGFALLGVLMSHALTGGGASSDWNETYKHWANLAVNDITRPLGMVNTQVDYKKVLGKVVQGYTYSDHGGPAYNKIDPPDWDLSSAGLGAGALSATLDDMLQFLEAQCSPPGSELGQAILYTQQPCPSDNGLSMGLGWQLSNGYLDKNGGVAGYETYMAFDPANQIGVFAFGNTSGDTGGDNITQHGRLLLGALRGTPANRSTFPKPTDNPTCPG
jgi:CubicO group peptidase (beta-lactamase class C family)